MDFVNIVAVLEENVPKRNIRSSIRLSIFIIIIMLYVIHNVVMGFGGFLTITIIIIITVSSTYFHRWKTVGIYNTRRKHLHSNVRNSFFVLQSYKQMYIKTTYVVLSDLLSSIRRFIRRRSLEGS